MVARFSQSLTRQTVIGTKSLQKNLHFFPLSTHLLADIDLKECTDLVFHVQVKWHKKWLRNILMISQEHYQFDDVIIGGKNEQEHDLILRKVLTRARERNIKFNRDKIQFRVNQVKHIGEVVGELGFLRDAEKISSIHNMPTPSCKQDLQRLLGMINYLRKYIPNMSELTGLLRSLLKGDVLWAWFPEHDDALSEIKSVLSSVPVLRFYDTGLPTTLQFDASKSGLGACLMQQGQPPAYASRTLSN